METGLDEVLSRYPEISAQIEKDMSEHYWDSDNVLPVDVQDEPDLATDELRPAETTESDVAEMTQEKTSTRAGIPAVLTVTDIKKQSHIELAELDDQ